MGDYIERRVQGEGNPGSSLALLIPAGFLCSTEDTLKYLGYALIGFGVLALAVPPAINFIERMYILRRRQNNYHQ